MSETSNPRPHDRADESPKERLEADSPPPFHREIARRERRRMKARRGDPAGLWYGLGMFGMVGWSVAVPTLIGLAIGIWLDRNTDRPYSFTLMGLLIGVLAGCGMAWYWVTRESGLHDSEDGPPSSPGGVDMPPHEQEDGS